MKTITKTIEELIKTEESPLPLEVIPNKMGINLCAVDSITWTRQGDKQLVNLTINFRPDVPEDIPPRGMKCTECGEIKHPDFFPTFYVCDDCHKHTNELKAKFMDKIWGARYWKIIEFADWKNCKDYELIGSKLKQKYSPDELKQFQAFYSKKLGDIKTVLEDYAEKKIGKRHGYYGLGDDGFWDLRAHIIGLGEEVYESVVKDPEIAKKMADERDFKENFGYIFHYTGHDNED